MTEKTGQKPASLRIDLIRATVLVVLTVLIWCTAYNRWNAKSWSTPITYTEDLQKGDVLQFFAEIKAARDGHATPPFFKVVPELNAPFEANWNDFPFTERLQFYYPGVLARFMGIFAAANFAILTQHILAALAFFIACRISKFHWVWSFAGGLLFSFSHFAFSHGEHHITVAYYWHVPLCMMVAGWILSGGGIRFDDKRFKIALLVAVITGIQNPYYTNIFAQFVLFGALAQWWRQRDWRVNLPPLTIIGTSAVSFLVMNSNVFLYHLLHGGNPGAVDRKYAWLEIYALKFVDMIIPPPGHWFGPFSSWGTSHVSQVAISPGELPASGYIGLVGIGIFLWLVIVAVRSIVERSTTKVPLEAWMVLWIMLYSDVGGVNGLIGTFGFQLFRATTRYSIVVFCIVLLFAVRRLSLIDFQKLGVKLSGIDYPRGWFAGSIACIVTLVGLRDQIPPLVSNDQIEGIAKVVDADKRFAENLERRFKPGSMIFQYPPMQFPEDPKPNIGSYDHFRPYLFSRDLRFSFGTDKGRAQDKWQQEIGSLRSLNEIVERLEAYGFSGLYVNRYAFPDGGADLVRGLQNLQRDEIITNGNGDVFCVVLKPSAHPISPAPPETKY